MGAIGRRAGRLAFTSARSVVLFSIVVLVFEVVPVVMSGATLGKAMFGLRLVAVDRSGHPSVPAACGRAVMLYAPPVALGLLASAYLAVLALSVALPASGRGVHDRLAGTPVLEIRPRG
ncbi:MAG: RDD family protein [Acidimicrobiales bacterium]